MEILQAGLGVVVGSIAGGVVGLIKSRAGRQEEEAAESKAGSPATAASAAAATIACSGATSTAAVSMTTVLQQTGSLATQYGRIAAAVMVGYAWGCHVTQRRKRAPLQVLEVPAEQNMAGAVCVICGEAPGVACCTEHAHHVCKSCLNQWVRRVATPEGGAPPAFHDGERFRGHPQCPGHDWFHLRRCPGRLSPEHFLRHLDGEAVQAWTLGMQRMVEAKRLLEHDDVPAVIEDPVAFFRQYIEENVLTLKCPRCQQAFVDFDGCLALTCSSCNAAFCGLCLQDCGSDAHAHVRECPDSPPRVRGELYMRLEEWKVFHQQRKDEVFQELADVVVAHLREINGRTAAVNEAQ